MTCNVSLCEIAPETRDRLLRKPAFGSVSLDNNPSSSKRRRKHKEQDEPGEEEHLSKKERKNRMVERAKVQLNEMTTEERQELYHDVQTQKWLNKKVEFDGEKVTTCAAMHLFSESATSSIHAIFVCCCWCCTVGLLHSAAATSDPILPLFKMGSHADIQVTTTGVCVRCTVVECLLPSLGPAVLQKTIRQLIREVEDEEGEAPQAQEGGVVDYTGRNKTAGLDEVPGWMLRPGAPKMQLRPEEEAQLPLVY